MRPLERFGLPHPETCGEHAECSHLISFLEEYVDEVISGKTTIHELKLDLELCRPELYETLGKCIQNHNELKEKNRC